MVNRGIEVLKETQAEFLRAMGIASVITLFLDALQLVVPIYMMQVFDRVMSSRSMETLTMLTIIAVIGIAMWAVLDFLRGRIFVVASHVVATRLNGPAFEAAVVDTLRGESSSANQAVRDVSDLRNFITGSAVLVPLEALFSPLFLVVLFLLHPMYGLIALIASVMLLVLSVINELATRRPLMEVNDAAVKSFSEIGAAVRHGEVLEAMGMTQAVTRRWQRSQNRFVDLMIRSHDRAKLITAVSKGVRMSLQVALTATAVVVVLHQSASPGSMFAAMLIMGRALIPFENMIEGYRQWVFAYAAFRRLRTLLSKTDSRRHGLDLPRPDPRVKVERLVFVPPGGDRAILKGISFQLEPGEVLGVVGPSGSGKSTLARVLVGVWEPTAGGVYLDGHNVYTWSRESFGRYAGYLPQSIALLDGTIRENIARMQEAEPHDVIEAARRADVHEIIGRMPFGYETHIGDANFVLSGGQRQRIALARALFGRPRLVVLDEPNSNLDQAGETALLQAIQAAKDDGATVIIIAHRPSVLATVDKVLVMRDGTIEHFGPREDVVKFGKLNLAPPPPRPTPVPVESGGLNRLPGA
ncbi:MAG TPA: type I secretion system permease/ATPase [Azospirillum sp.]|nr:type I secretion system permease/ATPase [Azospirillum sp.]